MASTSLAIAAPLSIGLDNTGLAPLLWESISIPPTVPATEAEIFTDLAHVGLDLLTFASPGRVLLRLGILCGRIFAMAADWIPDHNILPEELVFQSVMLLVAWVGLVNTLLPLLFANSKVSVRDGKAYRRLFESTGMSWSTFKSMAVLALDWVSVEANQTISPSEDFVYWLYSGNLTINDNLDHVVAHKTNGSKLLFERNLLKRMERKGAYWDQAPELNIQAGQEGATLLRIHVKPLTEMMNNDPDVAEAIRALLFRSTHEKLVDARRYAQTAV